MSQLQALQEMAAMLPNGCTVRAGTAEGVIVFIGMGAQIRTADTNLVAQFLLEEIRKQNQAGSLAKGALRRAEALADRAKRPRCRSCPHPHHEHSVCTGRSGGTAYACGCLCSEARTS